MRAFRVEAPRIHAVASVEAYRRLARELPRPTDVIIELGASTGKATALLAASCAKVVAVEKGRQILAQARLALAKEENVAFVQADALALWEVWRRTSSADLVFVDLGGNAPPSRVLDVAELYGAVYVPREMVVRNIPLCRFAGRLAACESVRPDRTDEFKGLSRFGRGMLGPLLHLMRAGDRRTRKAVIRAVGRLQDPAALGTLAAELGSRDRALRREARRAMWTIAKSRPQCLEQLLDLPWAGEGIVREINALAGRARRRVGS